MKKLLYFLALTQTVASSESIDFINLFKRQAVVTTIVATTAAPTTTVTSTVATTVSTTIPVTTSTTTRTSTSTPSSTLSSTGTEVVTTTSGYSNPAIATSSSIYLGDTSVGKSSTSNQLSSSAIVGLIFGGIAVVCLIVGVILLNRKKSRKRNGHGRNLSSLDSIKCANGPNYQLGKDGIAFTINNSTRRHMSHLPQFPNAMNSNHMAQAAEMYYPNSSHYPSFYGGSVQDGHVLRQYQYAPALVEPQYNQGITSEQESKIEESNIDALRSNAYQQAGPIHQLSQRGSEIYTPVFEHESNYLQYGEDYSGHTHI